MTFLHPVASGAYTKMLRLEDGVWVKQPALPHPKWFRHESEPVASIEDLDRAYARHGAAGGIVVRGDVAASAERVRRICNGPEAVVVGVAKPWLDFDVDGFPIPDSLDLLDGDRVARYVVGRFPEEFRDVDVRWQFTSQHGLVAKGRNARLRLSFLLDRPISDREAKSLVGWINESLTAQGYRPGIVDPALYNPVQPHFIAPPVCGGSPDFISRRSGVVKGAARRAVFVARAASGRRVAAKRPEGCIVPALAGGKSDDLLARLRAGEPLAAGMHDFVRSLALAWGRENQLALARHRNDGEADAMVERMAVRVREAVEEALDRLPGDRAEELRGRLVDGDEIDRLLRWVLDSVVGELRLDGRGRLHVSERAVPGEWRDAARELGRKEGAGARRFAWAMAERFQHRCPRLWSVDRMQRELGGLLEGCAGVDAADVADLGAYIAALAAGRKRRVAERFDLEAVRREAAARADVAVEAVELVGATSVEEARALIETRREGVFVVRAPHGTGKTRHLLRPLIGGVEGAIAVCHRRSLTAALADVLGTRHYRDESVNPQVKGKMSTCVDSLFAPRLKEFRDGSEALVVDEVDQTIGALHGRSQVRHKRMISDGLLAHIRATPLVVGCDADLSSATLAYLLESGRCVTVIDVQIPQATPTIRRLPDKAAAMRLVCDALGAGQRVRVVADSSVEKLKEWRTLAQEEGLEPAKMALVCSETVGDYPDLVRDIDANLDGVRLLAHSPSLGSGVSITRKHFDTTVAIYTGTASPEDFVQMLRRDRTAETIHLVLVGNAVEYAPEDDETWLRRKAEAVEGEARQSPIPQGWRRVFSPFTRRCAARETECNRMSNDAANNLLFLVEHRGWRVEESGLVTTREDRELARGVQVLTEAQFVEGILSTPDPDAGEIQRLLEERERGDEVRWDHDARLKWKRVTVRRDLWLTMERELTAEDVRFHDHGKAMGAIRRLEQVLDPEELLNHEAEWDLAREAHAQRNPKARQAAYRKLFEAMGVDPENGTGRVTAESALAAWQVGVAERGLYEEFGVRVPARAPAYPVKWARGVLATFGLRLGSEVRKGVVCPDEIKGSNNIGDPNLSGQKQVLDNQGERQNLYSLDRPSWEALMAVVLRRREGRLLHSRRDADDAALAYDPAFFPPRAPHEALDRFMPYLSRDMDAVWYEENGLFATPGLVAQWCEKWGLKTPEARAEYFARRELTRRPTGPG